MLCLNMKKIWKEVKPSLTQINTIINKNNISEASETTKQGTNDKGERTESIKELFIVLSWVFHIYNGMLK